jgi:hypothetical protein
MSRHDLKVTMMPPMNGPKSIVSQWRMARGVGEAATFNLPSLQWRTGLLSSLCFSTITGKYIPKAGPMRVPDKNL